MTVGAFSIVAKALASEARGFAIRGAIDSGARHVRKRSDARPGSSAAIVDASIEPIRVGRNFILSLLMSMGRVTETVSNPKANQTEPMYSTMAVGLSRKQSIMTQRLR